MNVATREHPAQERLRIMIVVGVASIVVAATLATVATVAAPDRIARDVTDVPASSTATTPWVLSAEETRRLVQHGVGGAALDDINAVRWETLRDDMADDRWIARLVRHRAGLTTADLADQYLARG